MNEEIENKNKKFDELSLAIQNLNNDIKKGDKNNEFEIIIKQYEEEKIYLNNKIKSLENKEKLHNNEVNQLNKIIIELEEENNNIKDKNKILDNEINKFKINLDRNNNKVQKEKDDLTKIIKELQKINEENSKKIEQEKKKKERKIKKK